MILYDMTIHIVTSLRPGLSEDNVGCSIFAATMIVVYSAKSWATSTPLLSVVVATTVSITSSINYPYYALFYQYGSSAYYQQ